MNGQLLHSMTTRRVLATGLALAVLFWQALLAGGQPMAPVRTGEAGFVICTEHGMQAVPVDGVPFHDPAGHAAPPCPCCFASAAADAAILPPSTVLAAPAWMAMPHSVVAATTVSPPPSAPDPLQPRAPPVSV